MIDRLYNHRYILGLGAAIVALSTKGHPDLIYLVIIGVGLIIRFWGVGYLGRDKGAGQPKKVITAGPYRLIRHPLYLGNGLIVLGFLLFLTVPVPIFILIMSGYLIFYTIFAIHEEKILSTYSVYLSYRLKVSPIIPMSIYNRSEGEFSLNNAISDYPAVIAVSLIITLSYLIGR